MSKNDAIILSVPCDFRFTAAVENSVRIVLPLLNGFSSDKLELELRTVLNEAFVNIVKHCKPKPKEMAKIVYSVHSNRLELNVFDSGKGLAVNNQLPPYPVAIVGTTQPLFKTFDGQVMAKVLDHNTLVAIFREDDIDNIGRDEIISSTKPGGLGIPIMTKLMDEVQFHYLGDAGQVLKMIKYFDK